MSKNYGLAGQAARETDGYGMDLKMHGLKSNWRAFSGLAGIRRQRRERAAQKLLDAAHGEPLGMTVAPKPAACQCFECWAYRATLEWWLEDDDNDGMPYSAETVTFDSDGAHVDNCDLPRCPECAEILGCKPWWEEQREADGGRE